MDIVMPYIKGNENCLKFALRSAEKNLLQQTRLVIVGTMPETIKPDIFIPVADSKKLEYRERNIFNKVLAAASDERVTDPFIYMHDDHFILTPHETIPDYFDDRFGGNNAYQKTVTNTNWPRNYDVHVPKVFEKERFMKNVASLNWNIKHGFCIKTQYCKYKTDTYKVRYPDLCIRSPKTYMEISVLIHGRRWFSCWDKAMNDAMIQILSQIFPMKSRWEN